MLKKEKKGNVMAELRPLYNFQTMTGLSLTDDGGGDCPDAE